MQFYKIGKQEFEVRGLTRREVKRFRAEGFDFAALQPEQTEEISDKVFEAVGLDLEAVDDLTYGEASDLFREIMRLSFLGAEDRKNSDSALT